MQERVLLSSEALRRVLVTAIFRDLAGPLAGLQDVCYDEDGERLQSVATRIRGALADVEILRGAEIGADIPSMNIDLDDLLRCVSDRVTEIKDCLFEREDSAERDKWFADHVAGTGFLESYGPAAAVA